MHVSSFLGRWVNTFYLYWSELVFHTCNVAFAFSRLNLSESLQDKEVDHLWQTADTTPHTHPPPHASSSPFSPLVSSPVHTSSPPHTLSFSLPLFCRRESWEERQIRLLPQKLPITAWQRVQHCCLANAEFVNPGSATANMWASFWACREWVKRAIVAI